MKKLLALVFFFPLVVFGAAFDTRINQFNAGGVSTTINVAPAANSILGFDNGKIVSNVTVSTGLSLVGGVLTATTAGTVSSVAETFTGGIISVAGSPITTSGTFALTVAGTSGGIPYFSDATHWATSGALAANALVIGGGAGVAPASTTTGTSVLTALGVNVGSAGAFVVNGGALGTPSSGTVTNLTGTASININGTVGATTPAAGTFTALTGTSGSITGLTALAIRDTSAAFDVTLAATSSTTLTAGRTLTFDVTNAARTIKLTGNPTLADWFDQAVKTGSSPTFVTVTAALSGNATTATTLATTRAIYGNNFDGSAALTQVIASTYGGTGNGFTKFTGPTTSEKTFTLPNASATILTDNAAVTVAQGGTGQTSYTNGQLLIGNTTGNTLAKATLTGTSNQVVVTNGTGTITLSTPQDIGTSSNPQFATIELGAATDTTLARASAGDVNIEGNRIYRAGGTTVPVTDGGSGAATFTAHGILLGEGTSALTPTAVGTAGQIIIGVASSDPVWRSDDEYAVQALIDGGTSAATAVTADGVVTIGYNATIVGYYISAQAADTCTVKIWKVATGTANPTVSDNISTSGVALSTGTYVASTTTSDFTTTTVTAGDIFRVNWTAVGGTATWFKFGLLLRKR